MARDKADSLRKRRSKAVPILGAAGLSLTLASAASAAIHQPDVAARHARVTQEIALAEENVSGASLATFHVFDKEHARPARGTRFAMGVGGGCGGCGCGGCGGCWTGTYY